MLYVDLQTVAQSDLVKTYVVPDCLVFKKRPLPKVLADEDELRPLARFLEDILLAHWLKGTFPTFKILLGLIHQSCNIKVPLSEVYMLLDHALATIVLFRNQLLLEQLLKLAVLLAQQFALDFESTFRCEGVPFARLGGLCFRGEEDCFGVAVG